VLRAVYGSGKVLGRAPGINIPGAGARYTQLMEFCQLPSTPWILQDLPRIHPVQSTARLHDLAEDSIPERLETLHIPSYDFFASAFPIYFRLPNFFSDSPRGWEHKTEATVHPR
jgi:hypothetical protein